MKKKVSGDANEFIGGEAETRCWKDILNEFRLVGFSDKQLQFKIISCAKIKDGARIYFHQHFLKLLKKRFQDQEHHKKEIIFSKNSLLLKMNYEIGRLFIRNLMLGILIDLLAKEDSEVKTEPGPNLTRSEKKREEHMEYLRDNLRIMNFCQHPRCKKNKVQITVFFKEEDGEYYAIIRTCRGKEADSIGFAHRYPKIIIRKAIQHFFEAE